MVNLYRRGRIQEKKVENSIKSNDTETMIKKLTSKLEDKLSQHYLGILVIILVITIFLAYLAYTKIYENSILLLSLTFFLVLNFSMTGLLIGLRQSLEELIINNKPLFICFIIMALALSIINMPVLMGDFNFNPTAIQQTILESSSVAGAVNVKNDMDTLKNKLLDKRYFTHF
jgi:uncharacterized membrane protein